MVNIITRIFEVDPMVLEIMRIDLAADVRDIPVSWFRRHARFKYKRSVRLIAKPKEDEFAFVTTGTALAETFYAVQTANVFRIYNKVQELRKQWLKLKRERERYNRRLAEFDSNPELCELTADNEHMPSYMCPR